MPDHQLTNETEIIKWCDLTNEHHNRRVRVYDQTESYEGIVEHPRMDGLPYLRIDDHWHMFAGSWDVEIFEE
jgi:hypothetical protein